MGSKSVTSKPGVRCSQWLMPRAAGQVPMFVSKPRAADETKEVQGLNKRDSIELRAMCLWGLWTVDLVEMDEWQFRIAIVVTPVCRRG